MAVLLVSGSVVSVMHAYYGVAWIGVCQLAVTAGIYWRTQRRRPS
jgi:hypothetical protein